MFYKQNNLFAQLSSPKGASSSFPMMGKCSNFISYLLLPTCPLSTCLPTFISVLNWILSLLSAKSELDALPKAQMRVLWAPQDWWEEEGGWSAKGKKRLCWHFLSTVLGTSYAVSPDHPRQSGGIIAEETEAHNGGATWPGSSITRHHMSNCWRGNFCWEAKVGRDAHVGYEDLRCLQGLVILTGFHL